MAMYLEIGHFTFQKYSFGFFLACMVLGGQVKAVNKT